MALPTTPEMQALAARAFKRHLIEQEATLLELLGKWVSELEPVVVYGHSGMFIAGIGIKGDPTGALVIANPRCPPESRFTSWPLAHQV